MEAKLNHPAGATSVSLRASATDRDGNTVKQTIIRAYNVALVVTLGKAVHRTARLVRSVHH